MIRTVSVLLVVQPPALLGSEIVLFALTPAPNFSSSLTFLKMFCDSMVSCTFRSSRNVRAQKLGKIARRLISKTPATVIVITTSSIVIPSSVLSHPEFANKRRVRRSLWYALIVIRDCNFNFLQPATLIGYGLFGRFRWG